MKLKILLAGVLMLTASLSGCTTRDWIQAVGGLHKPVTITPKKVVLNG